jgi:hypothetical protein
MIVTPSMPWASRLTPPLPLLCECFFSDADVSRVAVNGSYHNAVRRLFAQVIRLPALYRYTFCTGPDKFCARGVVAAALWRSQCPCISGIYIQPVSQIGFSSAPFTP